MDRKILIEASILNNGIDDAERCCADCLVEAGFQKIFLRYYLGLLFLSIVILSQNGASISAQKIATEFQGSRYAFADQSVDKFSLDTSWRSGELVTGLRYSIRHNTQPKDTIAIRIHVAAGALIEDDHQKGWAHLLEHMLFRGTKNYPDGEASKTWQRMGASFGQDSNAQTSLTSTIYILDLPKNDQASYEEALMILADMMQHATIDPAILETERQVVTAERAARQPPLARKIRKASEDVLLTGLRAAKRDIGGTDETLASATTEELRAFYRRWYRPSRTTIVVVGDANEKMLADGIKKAFGNWKNDTAEPLEPDYGSVQQPPSPTAIVTDAQAPNVLQLAWMHNHDISPFTEERQKRQYLDSLATRIVNQRLATAAQQDNAIVNAGARWGEARSVANQLTVSVSPKAGDWRTALNETFSIINGLKTEPPSQFEIDQQYAEIQQALEKRVELKDSLDSPALANGYVRDVDQGDVTGAPEYYLELLKSQKPELTSEAVLSAIQDLLAPEPRMIVLSPQEFKGGETAGNEALKQAVLAKPVAVQALREVSLDEIELPSTPGTVASVLKIDDLGIERIFFDNGVELALKQTDFKKGSVKISVMVGGGVLSQPKDEPGLFWTASGLGASGFGPFTSDELARLFAGRQLNFSFAPETSNLLLTGNTNKNDSADMLRLMTTAMTQMRYDPVVVSRLKDQIKSNYQAYYASPALTFQTFASPYLHGGDRRFQGLPSLDAIDALTPTKFRSLWEKQLASGPIKIVVVGDFDRNQIVESVTATIGALPERRIQKDDNGSSVKPTLSQKSPVILKHKGSKDQAFIATVFPTTGSLRSLEIDNALDVTAKILAIRLTETFRHKDGSSYAPFVTSNQSRDLPNYGTIVAGSQLKMDDIEAFNQTLGEIIDDIAKNGPSEDLIRRAIETRKSDIANGLQTNNFWTARLKGDLDNENWLEETRTMEIGFDTIDGLLIQKVAQDYLLDGSGSFEIHVLNESHFPNRQRPFEK